MADINIYDGLFVSNTDVLDVSEIYDTDVTSPEFKELLVRLYQNLNRVRLALNIKDSAWYDTNQFVNGQIFFPNPLTSTYNESNPDRQVFRLVINFGALPNTGTTAVAHGITCTGITTFTRIYGVANDTTGKNYIPIPYASPTLANNIELKVDATNVTIITGSNRTAFTICYIVIEFLQQ